MATPNLGSITNVIPGILASMRLASGGNAVFTVASGKAAKLATLVLTNTSTSNVVISVSVVPSGGTADGTHTIVSGYQLAPGETLALDEVKGMWVGDSDSISVAAGAANAVVVTLTGLVFS